MRTLISFAIALLLAVSYGLYQLKYSVETLRERAVALDRQIEVDKDSIDVLHAEWALLTRPQRLQKLSSRFLELTPLRPEQIASLPDLVEQSPAALPFDDPWQNASFETEAMHYSGNRNVTVIQLPARQLGGEPGQ